MCFLNPPLRANSLAKGAYILTPAGIITPINNWECQRIFPLENKTTKRQRPLRWFRTNENFFEKEKGATMVQHDVTAGIAEEIFLSDPTHSHLTEYNDIARILINRFEKAVPLSTRLQLFSSCIQGSSKDVQEFAARINKLGTQIFQSGNSAQKTVVRNANDQLLQARFKSGLRNDIRRFVLARDPLNLDESITAALIEEQNMKLNQIANDERSGLSPSQTENSVISALTNKLEEINLRVGRLQEASSVTARKTGGDFFNRRETVFKCFYCGIQEHRQAECRKKKRDERKANYQPPRRSAASEFSVFRHPGTHPFDRRHVHFQESAFRDNYAAPRHSARESHTTSRNRGFQRNTRNDNLNFHGESRI
ncbi:hypothetical protein TNCV_1802921 [Trichonephila clavipes]|uniref:CCHC-type domain-containing protein n=1 Tax=Trichonephila clavipes TaxID=2585209 RepID=A0A8X6SHH5_TRICX|nr:hypothetical protein TNCV_1802921 [Trichonephila clavipes]